MISTLGVFFFQAEDGIRDYKVTGVQTCALPISSAPGTLEYGGGITAFSHDGSDTGAIESNPHNLVHIMVGGLQEPYGFMSDPDYAALDPIFWVHHCNVDRLWAAWLKIGRASCRERV